MLLQKIRKKDHNKENVTSLRKNSFVSKNFYNVLNDVDDTTLNVTNAIDESSSKSETTISSSKKLSVTILGDSILKDVKSYKMKKAIKHQANIYVKSFSGATVDDMVSYVLPTKKHDPDIVVLYCRTNDLKESKEPKRIAENIINLALSMISEKTNAVISSLTARKDNLDTKRVAVNVHLKRNCSERNMAYIENENIDGRTHLNKSGLHLNMLGIDLLSYNYLCHISEFLK